MCFNSENIADDPDPFTADYSHKISNGTDDDDDENSRTRCIHLNNNIIILSSSTFFDSSRVTATS